MWKKDILKRGDYNIYCHTLKIANKHTMFINHFLKRLHFDKMRSPTLILQQISNKVSTYIFNIDSRF